MTRTNLDYLKNITDNDSTSMREIIELFIEQVPQSIDNMHKYLGEKRYVELAKEAHKAKSSVEIVGMSDLGQALKTLQQSILDQKDQQTYYPIIWRFEKECLEAIEELKKAMTQF